MTNLFSFIDYCKRSAFSGLDSSFACDNILVNCSCACVRSIHPQRALVQMRGSAPVLPTFCPLHEIVGVARCVVGRPWILGQVIETKNSIPSIEATRFRLCRIKFSSSEEGALETRSRMTIDSSLRRQLHMFAAHTNVK